MTVELHDTPRKEKKEKKSKKSKEKRDGEGIGGVYVWSSDPHASAQHLGAIDEGKTEKSKKDKKKRKAEEEGEAMVVDPPGAFSAYMPSLSLVDCSLSDGSR